MKPTVRILLKCAKCGHEKDHVDSPALRNYGAACEKCNAAFDMMTDIVAGGEIAYSEVAGDVNGALANCGYIDKLSIESAVMEVAQCAMELGVTPQQFVIWAATYAEKKS